MMFLRWEYAEHLSNEENTKYVAEQVGHSLC